MELDLEFSASVKAATDHLAAIDKWNKRANGALPIMDSRTAAGVALAGIPTVLTLGSPSVGRVWSPRLFTVLGADDHTVVAATSWAVYVGDPANFNVGQCVIPGTLGTVPGFYDLGKDVLWIQSEETVFVVVTGAGAAQQLVANMKMMEFEEEYVTPSMTP